MKMKLLLIILFPIAGFAQIKCDTARYKPGFTYFDGSTGEEVTLIKIEEHKPHPDFLKQFPNYCPLIVWDVLIHSEKYGRTIKWKVGETSIDMALGKAYAYHGQVIYYDSEQDCNSKGK